MQFQEPIYSDLDFMTIEEIKKETTWPYDWVAVKGLIPYIKRLKGEIVGLEIGTCRAESTVLLLESCPNIKKLYTLDPFKEFSDWVGVIKQETQDKWRAIARKNLEPFGERAVMLSLSSRDAVMYEGFSNDSLDFLFVDGDHSFEGALFDFENYYPKVKKGGIFAGHDYQLAGIRNALTTFRDSNKVRIPVNRVDNNAWFWMKQ